MTQTYQRRAAISAALAAFGFGSFLSTQTASAQRPDNDYDNDGINNKVDRDDDNDGIKDKRDRDDDNDGVRDKRDRDDDNDGIRDQNDRDQARRGVRGRTYVVEPRLQGEWRFNYHPFRYDDRHYDDLDSYDLGYGFDQPEFYGHFQRDYMHFDRNRDGRLELGERQAFWIHMAREGMFGPMSASQARQMGFLAASLDSNGNGQLTSYEVRRLTRFIKAQRLFVAFDRNRDGRLMRHETRGWFTREFNALDLNGDRIVTRAEMRRSLLGQPRRTYWSWR